MERRFVVILLLCNFLIKIVNSAISVDATSGTSVKFSGQGSNQIGVEIKWNGNGADSEYIFSTSDPFIYPIVPFSYYTYEFENGDSGSFVSLPLPPNNPTVIFPRLASSVTTDWTPPIFSGRFNGQDRTVGNLVSCPTCSAGYRVCVTLLGVTTTASRYELNTTCANYTLITLSSVLAIPAAHAFHLDIYTYGDSNKGEYLSPRIRLIDGAVTPTGPNQDIVPVSAPNLPQFSVVRFMNSFTISFSDKLNTDAIRFTSINTTMNGTSRIQNIDYWAGHRSVTVNSSIFSTIRSSQRFQLSAYHVLSYLNAVLERTAYTTVYTKPGLAQNFVISSSTIASVSISFEHPSNRGDGALYYSVSYNNQQNQTVVTTVSGNNLSSAGGTVALDNNLRPNQVVVASFTTINSDYNNDPSLTNAVFSAATSPTIDGFGLVSVSSNQVSLNWTYTSNKVFPVKDSMSDDLNIVACVQASSPSFSSLAKCSAPITNYSPTYSFTSGDNVIQPSVNYISNVTFINRRLNQLRGSSSLVFTSAPSNFNNADILAISDNPTSKIQTTRTTNSISIRFDSSILNEGDYTSGQISVICCIRDASQGGAYNCINSVYGIVSSICTFSTLPKISNRYEVTLQKRNLNSLLGEIRSSQITVYMNTRPNAPSGLKITSVGPITISLLWTIPSDYDSVYFRTNIGFRVCSVDKADATNTATCTDLNGKVNSTTLIVPPLSDYQVSVATLNSFNSELDTSIPIYDFATTLIPILNIKTVKVNQNIANVTYELQVPQQISAAQIKDKLATYDFSYLNRQNQLVTRSVNATSPYISLDGLKFSFNNSVQYYTTTISGSRSTSQVISIATNTNSNPSVIKTALSNAIQANMTDASDDITNINSIPATYVLQVSTAQTNGETTSIMTIVGSTTSSDPLLQVGGLQSGTPYTISYYSYNNLSSNSNGTMISIPFGTANKLLFANITRDDSSLYFRWLVESSPISLTNVEAVVSSSVEVVRVPLVNTSSMLQLYQALNYKLSSSVRYLVSIEVTNPFGVEKSEEVELAALNDGNLGLSIAMGIIIPLIAICALIVAVVLVGVAVIAFLGYRKYKNDNPLLVVTATINANIVENSKSYDEAWKTYLAQNGFPENLMLDHTKFDMSQISEPVNNGNLKKSKSMKIGGGAFGNVCKTKYEGSYVAVKVLSHAEFSGRTFPDEVKDFCDEALNLFKAGNHPNVVRFFGFTAFSKDNIYMCYIVTEFARDGDMANFISKNPNMSFDQKVELVSGVAAGIGYLHSKEIVHRDLKLENVLLDSGIPKIIDFGGSKAASKESKDGVPFGTSDYMAPELLVRLIKVKTATSAFALASTSTSEEEMIEISSFDEYKLDTYSFGVLMYCIFFQQIRPYGKAVQDTALASQMRENKNYRPEIFADRVRPEHTWYIDLMKKCWSGNVQERPNFVAICELLEQKIADMNEGPTTKVAMSLEQRLGKLNQHKEEEVTDIPVEKFDV